MADRREQLLQAFNEVEEDEEVNAGEESADGTNPVDGPGDGADSSGETNSGTDAAESADESGTEDAGAKGQPEGKKADSKDAEKAATGKKTGKAVPDKAKAAKKGGGADADGAPDKTADELERQVAEAGEAPRAWKVGTRQHWTKLPADVREEINRRETEITRFISQHGLAIQHKQQFDEVIEPFKPFIAAQRSTPMKAVHNMMSTAARLITGGPRQKASTIAEIMRNYDVDVRELDAVLAAAASGAPAQGGSAGNVNETPPSWAQPLLQFMTQAQRDKQARAEREQQEAAAEVQKMESLPYFNDMREDIGVLMERATAKKQTMTLKQAYDRARKLPGNEEIDKLLTAKERAAAARNSGTAAPGSVSAAAQTLARARRAGSTVRGAPVTGATAQAGKKKDEKVSRREQLAAAFDEAGED